ncbi:hypothetical protein DCAR_0101816 [Daucus carota subsp. sativus]|uniref:EamA domain-containing protein n=1 Tax=Daucus carota subsp. sativus TaxID=79200 RepID=A0A162AHC3_DAUCS|nr:PREDICTED: WAT1-related protein At1g25270-like [Daucus carota subsp. sativus]WOG82650.1 hypothetical protein DCAR_0101816 [Daucus carota subsp. sativus]
MEVKMDKICNVVHGFKPTILMLIVQTAFAGVNVLYKLASNDGMNLRILVAYRFIFAAAFIVPVALFVERKKRPKMTWMVILQGFFCGLLGGSLAQNLYVQCLVLTSATFASATTNLIPAITFVLAICFRLEKLNWDKASGKAKVIGTLMGISGAMVLTFYKGPDINFWNTHINLLDHTHEHGGHVPGTHPNRILGACFALGSCICYALWLILQAKMVERYPCPYSSTALMATMGAIQGTIFALCMERDWSLWKLGWNIRLLTVAYAGVLASGVMFTLVAWCIRMRGPLFVSVFNPLMLVLVAIAGSLVLNEHLHLGSVIGAITIVCGLYAVLWGKGKEMKRIAQLMPEVSSGDSSKPIEIVITSSPGASETRKDAVCASNNTSEANATRSPTNNNINEVTANNSPATLANTCRESDEIGIVKE